MQFAFSITLTGWQDGHRVTTKLAELDRWAVHAAETLVLQLCQVTIKLEQEPRSISAAKIGVGAVLWDGSITLAAYIVRHASHSYIGMRCVELGCGVGVVGITLAMLGAKAILTDKESVMPICRRNLALNGFNADATSVSTAPAAAYALEWGSQHARTLAAALRRDGVDLVLGADVCYIDQDGVSPSTAAFVETCAALCTQHTKVWICQELRSSSVRDTLLQEAAKHFSQVKKLSLAGLPEALQTEYVELFEFRL